MWRFWTSDKGAEADSDGLAVWESADDTDFAIHSGDCAPRPHQAKCNSLTNNKLYISFEWCLKISYSFARVFQPHIIPHSFCFPVIEFPPVYAGVRSLFKKSHITATKVEKKGLVQKKIIIFLTLVTSSCEAFIWFILRSLKPSRSSKICQKFPNPRPRYSGRRLCHNFTQNAPPEWMVKRSISVCFWRLNNLGLVWFLK